MSTIETLDDTKNVEEIRSSEINDNNKYTADQKSEQCISSSISKVTSNPTSECQSGIKNSDSDILNNEPVPQGIQEKNGPSEMEGHNESLVRENSENDNSQPTTKNIPLTPSKSHLERKHEDRDLVTQKVEPQDTKEIRTSSEIDGNAPPPVCETSQRHMETPISQSNSSTISESKQNIQNGDNNIPSQELSSQDSQKKNRSSEIEDNAEPPDCGKITPDTSPSISKSIPSTTSENQPNPVFKNDEDSSTTKVVGPQNTIKKKQPSEIDDNDQNLVCKRNIQDPSQSISKSIPSTTPETRSKPLIQNDDNKIPSQELDPQDTKKKTGSSETNDNNKIAVCDKTELDTSPSISTSTTSESQPKPVLTHDNENVLTPKNDHSRNQLVQDAVKDSTINIVSKSDISTGSSSGDNDATNLDKKEAIVKSDSHDDLESKSSILPDLSNDSNVTPVEVKALNESPSLNRLRKSGNTGLSQNNLAADTNSTDENGPTLSEKSEVSIKIEPTVQNDEENKKNVTDMDRASLVSIRAPFQSISRGGPIDGDTLIGTPKQKKSVSFMMETKQVSQEAFTSIQLDDTEDEHDAGNYSLNLFYIPSLLI